MKPSSLNILINDSYYNDKKDIIAPIDTSSILAFSEQDMYAMAHEGINITKLVMQDLAPTDECSVSDFNNPRNILNLTISASPTVISCCGVTRQWMA